MTWRGGWSAHAMRRPSRISNRSSPPYDAIIVVQAESFVDLRRLGHADCGLPAFDELKERAISSGLLEVPCEGAYTLRPESAVITGLGFSEQGFDRFHPYLRPQRLAADGAAAPAVAERAGIRCLCIPTMARSSAATRAMPVLGFAEFADERAFAGARRVGPYVCDDAVADFLLAEARERGAQPSRRLFAYAVTMEAHDPYGPGRLPGRGRPDPAIYPSYRERRSHAGAACGATGRQRPARAAGLLRRPRAVSAEPLPIRSPMREPTMSSSHLGPGAPHRHATLFRFAARASACVHRTQRGRVIMSDWIGIGHAAAAHRTAQPDPTSCFEVATRARIAAIRCVVSSGAIHSLPLALAPPSRR